MSSSRSRWLVLSLASVAWVTGCKPAIDPGCTSDCSSPATVSCTAPISGAVVGGASLALSATARTPAGPARVTFLLQQGSVSASVDASAAVGDTSSAVLPLAGSGLHSGLAQLSCSVRWAEGGVEQPATVSAPVALTLDEDAPVISGTTTAPAFSSAVAPGASPTALVTAQVDDVGAAGVDPSTVSLTAHGHSYPAEAAPDAASGAGAYRFAVPLADLGVDPAGSGQVPVVVTAQDRVGNRSSFDGGTVGVDNQPPELSGATLDTVTVFDGGAVISASISVADPAGGAGVDPASVQLQPEGGVAAIPAASGLGGVWTFSVSAAALQAEGAQGPVAVHFVARDGAGNAAVSATQTLQIDRRGPVIAAPVVTPNPAAGSHGFYAAATGTTVPVDVAIDDGSTGSGVAEASLSVALAAGGSTSVVGTGSAGTGSARTFHFEVPSTVQLGSEAPVAFTVSAVDGVGNVTVASSGAVGLPIDDSGPVVSSIQGMSPDVTVGQVPWYGQSGADIQVRAVISDSGGGVNVASLKLMAGGVQLSVGAPTRSVPAPDQFTFTVQRVNGLVPAGEQAPIAFTVVGQDTLGHPLVASGSSSVLGIDGQAPVVTFTPAYPAAGAGCDGSAGTDSGGNAIATGALLCGHDGAHFWRAASDATPQVYGVDDGNGSGVGTAGTASCTIPGTSCSVTAATGGFQFTFDPAAATFSSAADGSGSVPVTVTARDLLGNPGSATVNVQLTRVKWVRTMPSDFGVGGSLGGAVIVTPPLAGAAQLFLGSSGSGDTVASLNTRGGLQRTQLPAGPVTAVTRNMAYSPQTQRLYVVTEGSSTLSAFAASATAPYLSLASGGFACALGGGTQLTGSPAVIGTGTDERALAFDRGNHLLRSVAGDSGGCDPAHSSTAAVGSGAPTGSTPTTDGATVWLPYFNSSTDHGLVQVPFASGALGAPVLIDLHAQLGTASTFGAAAVTPTSLYVADDGTPGVYRALNPGTLTARWTGSAPGAMQAAISSTPLVAAGRVLGTSADGQLRAFAAADGSPVFHFPASGALGAIGPPALAADGAIYFTDASGALDAVRPGTPSATPAPGWAAPFTGPSGAGWSGVTAEPTLAPDGTLYFGAGSRIYALWTDSGGGAGAGSEPWPREGFDSCNSGNSAFTSCP